MTNAEHIVEWANNDGALYNRMMKLATLGNYIGTVHRFNDASRLAADAFRKMRRANDAPASYDENDIAAAVVLFLAWRPEA